MASTSNQSQERKREGAGAVPDYKSNSQGSSSPTTKPLVELLLPNHDTPPKDMVFRCRKDFLCNRSARARRHCRGVPTAQTVQIRMDCKFSCEEAASKAVEVYVLAVYGATDLVTIMEHDLRDSQVEDTPPAVLAALVRAWRIGAAMEDAGFQNRVMHLMLDLGPEAFQALHVFDVSDMGVDASRTPRQSVLWRWFLDTAVHAPVRHLLKDEDLKPWRVELVWDLLKSAFVPDSQKAAAPTIEDRKQYHVRVPEHDKRSG